MLRSDDSSRLPEGFRKSLQSFATRRPVYQVLRRSNLATVCEEAKCPNIGECFGSHTATFMIMGDRCTRRCHFCSVTTKKPLPLDDSEPERVALAAKSLDLNYVVITSVDRDDLPDLGADHFSRVVHTVDRALPHARVEVLVPDFRGRAELIDRMLDSPLAVFGHNIETCARLYKQVRPQSEFTTSLSVLKHASSRTLVKSGMMIGLGETDDEVLDTMSTIRDLGVSIVTIGQYLRPTKNSWPVHRYVSQDSYDAFLEHGKHLGFSHVFAGPFVRSSYRAHESFAKAMRSRDF